jgi:hypothetical protein
LPDLTRGRPPIPLHDAHRLRPARPGRRDSGGRRMCRSARSPAGKSLCRKGGAAGISHLPFRNPSDAGDGRGLGLRRKGRNQVRRRLAAGGRWIRTLGPPNRAEAFSRLPPFDVSVTRYRESGSFIQRPTGRHSRPRICRSIGAKQLVSNQQFRREPLLLEQLAHRPQRRARFRSLPPSAPRSERPDWRQPLRPEITIPLAIPPSGEISGLALDEGRAH